MFYHTRSGSAHNANRVRLVHHDAGAVAFAHRNKLGQRGNVAFHGKDAVYHHQLSPFIGKSGKHLVQRLSIVVREPFQRTPGKQGAIYYGGVVEFICNYVVALQNQGGNCTQVGLVTGGKTDAVLHVKKIRQFFLKFYVDIQGAVQEARAGASGAVFLSGLNSRFLYARVGGESQIVVGTKHYHALAAYYHVVVRL
jgi:hypothetical protein